MKQLKTLIEQDSMRMAALKCVAQFNLPQGYIASGFVRNLVWDHLHQPFSPTPLNDIDVIYYAPDENVADYAQQIEQALLQQMPEVNWQVRNQYYMHKRNGDRAYHSVIDAMSFWPEKETAVAIRLTHTNQIECISAFGFESLFDLSLTYNPKRSREIFERRIKEKGWLTRWPKLVVR